MRKGIRISLSYFFLDLLIKNICKGKDYFLPLQSKIKTKDNMKYLKTDLLGKCIRWRQRGVCIVMKVEAVTETKVLGSNAIICERVKCDYLNSYTEVSNTKSTFTLYIDGDSINDVEIINEEVYNQLIELYRETNTSNNKLSNLAKYG